MPVHDKREGVGATKRKFKEEREKIEENTKICEVCGQRMERDPESGEYYCPDCYDPDL